MNHHWTANDIPDLTDKVVIVTGANSGIGFAASLDLARKGAHTILACRSADKGRAALAALQAEIPDASADLMQLDLASLGSVRGFAEEFRSRHDRLDVLANNAGIMMVPYGLTDDGFESQFGVNHLGHFALTGLLLNTILGTPGSRVVNVSSTGHRRGSMDFDNLMWESGDYSRLQAYGRSKLANLLFTYELQRRFEAAEVDAMALAAHPGISDTDLGRYLMERWYMRLTRPLWYAMSQSADMGALPTLRAAVDPEASGGGYYGPGGFKERRGYPVAVKSNGASRNEADARRLWHLSEELTGVRYEALEDRTNA
jgi:NAD(P)-dependent dehydrogenase (short-subunit alcohol dehydrogenase family)